MIDFLLIVQCVVVHGSHTDKVPMAPTGHQRFEKLLLNCDFELHLLPCFLLS